MPALTQENMPFFMKVFGEMSMSDKLLTTSFERFSDFLKRPKFRKMREVHAARARKLRRRGEHVYFLRWEHGHCIYGWSGSPPDTFVINRMPRKQSNDPVTITASNLSYGIDWGYCQTKLEKSVTNITDDAPRQRLVCERDGSTDPRDAD